MADLDNFTIILIFTYFGLKLHSPIVHSAVTVRMKEKHDGAVRDASNSSSQEVANNDPNAPSAEISSKRQSLSDIFTIVRFNYWGCALTLTACFRSVPALH
jgi:hypothetical protein